ncbi:uncharacterized protein C8Q71DRAFT_381181 [Rhodofomes roseus]|uniref:Uncharacterized protein n=1 Tax=Rhodofomes roseus TaxID=34475 RepID=A0ABQ8K133_9APHY|nr:uncharacterized protein C8Q71DRAFT_381181 [Rhodofomes roseus]KAH9830178.1 hypothetical protein C8Q71DRAFT_381181 [Rhodofomes roseus]
MRVPKIRTLSPRTESLPRQVGQLQTVRSFDSGICSAYTISGYDDLLSANHDPLSLAASNRFRRSLYTTRPGPSNSLMSENAAEFRSRRAREQLSSISGVNNGRTSPIDEPRFAPADWSLPSFRGSTRASEQDSTDSRRSQTSRARPTTLEPDPFDSDYGLSHTGTELNHPQFNSLWQPLPSLSGGADPDESLDFPDLMLRRNSPPPRNAANTTAATRAASALHRAPYGALEQWLLGGPDDTASAAQTETQRPRAADANRARTVPHSDRPPRVMSYQPLSARMADADRRAQLESMASDAGVSVEELTRRGMSRLVAIRERRTATAPANRNAPRPAARPSSPGSRRAERDTEQSRSDYDLDARAELRASIAPPRIYDSPPRSTSRTVPSAASASRRPSVTGETSARTAPTVRFNVDSFHEGPFRASIQRSLELQNMTSEVTRPSSRTVPRDSGAPSLPPLRFQRLSTERLVRHCTSLELLES